MLNSTMHGVFSFVYIANTQYKQRFRSLITMQLKNRNCTSYTY